MQNVVVVDTVVADLEDVRGHHYLLVGYYQLHLGPLLPESALGLQAVRMHEGELKEVQLVFGEVDAFGAYYQQLRVPQVDVLLGDSENRGLLLGGLLFKGVLLLGRLALELGLLLALLFMAEQLLKPHRLLSICGNIRQMKV